MDEPDAASLGRARGAMYGLAIGDAMGMPSQLLSRAQVIERYGPLIGEFFAGPHDHPIAAGLPAGTVTDDTEQAVLIGRLLVAGGGHVEANEVAAGLVEWERQVEARGSLDLLGPSSRAAIRALAAGAPADEAGRQGTTNGAAMRIAAVGIATPPGLLRSGAGISMWAALVEQVVAVSQVTHNTGIALAGAAAVAAAVSAGVGGGDGLAARTAAIEAAHLAAGRGHWVAGADVAARIDWAAGLVAGLELEAAMEMIVSLVGTSLATQESVPAAFAVLAAVPLDPWLAIRVAASLGGDTDTIAAMVGAMAGAVHGVDSWPVTARQVADANDLHLRDLADDLVRLRANTIASDSPGALGAGVAPLGSGAPASPVGAGAPEVGSSAMTERAGAAAPRLLLVGEAVLDVTTWLAAAPSRGGDVIASAAAMTPGGGFNVMAAAARQGMPVLYAGRHGAGPAGDSIRRALHAEGIIILGGIDPDADSGFVVTTVEPDGERTFVTSPAALMTAGPAQLAAIPVQPGDVVYASGYGLASSSGDDLVRWLVALDPAVTVVVDPGPIVAGISADRLDAALTRIDWWSCNTREAALLSGFDDPARSAVDLARKRPSGGVIVRTGASGCLLVDRARASTTVVAVPAPAVEVVDTTGAGDSHVGVFVAGLAAGLAPLDAARRANVAAALSVTQRGPAAAPTAAVIDRWLDLFGGREGS